MAHDKEETLAEQGISLLIDIAIGDGRVTPKHLDRINEHITRVRSESEAKHAA